MRGDGGPAYPRRTFPHPYCEVPHAQVDRDRRVLAALCGAAKANAGWVIEGSVGKGGKVTEPRAWAPTNIMAAPGYELLGMLRLQLGIVGSRGGGENGECGRQ